MFYKLIKELRECINRKRKETPIIFNRVKICENTGFSSLRPEKTNSGDILDKCKGCPIRVGTAFDKNKIEMLELKIKMLENQIYRMKNGFK
jgi:hypothetical protein